MDMGIVSVPVIDRDPIEPGPEIALHLGDEVTGEGLQIGHLGGILRCDDEAEVMPIVMAAPCEGRRIGPVLRRAEHVRLFAVTGDAVALQVGDMGGERRRPEGAAPMPERGLKDRIFFLRAAREPTDAPGGSQAMSMAWLPPGAPLLSRPSCGRVPSAVMPRRRAVVFPLLSCLAAKRANSHDCMRNAVIPIMARSAALTWARRDRQQAAA